jgi:hypothetical protein
LPRAAAELGRSPASPPSPASLGVVVPSANNLLKADIARLYQNFLFSLWPRKPLDPEHEAARRTLVARLAALPIEP